MYDSDIPLKFLQIDLDFKLLWTVEITIHYLLFTEKLYCFQTINFTLIGLCSSNITFKKYYPITCFQI
jgi:hypothetical protein